MQIERKTNVIELKKIMVERGVEKIKDLSEMTGVNRNTVSDVIKGKIQPSAEVMVRFVDALGIPASKAGEIFFAENLRDA